MLYAHSHGLLALVPYSTSVVEWWYCPPSHGSYRHLLAVCSWLVVDSIHLDLPSWRSHGGNQHSTWILRDPVLVVVAISMLLLSIASHHVVATLLVARGSSRLTTLRVCLASCSGLSLSPESCITSIGHLVMTMVVITSSTRIYMIQYMVWW